MFIKMFWCKYICPLGAASNIFKFTITFVCIFGAYLLLVLFGIQISWVLPLAIVCIAGYLSEIIYRKSKVFPVMSVCRNDELCNKCGLCAKKCPYSINIPEVNKVKCVDCTLCGECISACNKGALTFSGKKSLRWAPAIISVVLFVIAVFMGTTVELPTIDEKWGDESKHANLEKLTVEGLRSVKCFGSSKAFSAQVQKIPGAYGVETYVKHSRVNIWYNPAETTPEAIQKAIYVPSKFKINHPSQEDSLIKVITIRTENMHDKMDPNYLGLQFRASGKKYFGLETEYDCPIIVRLYMGMDEEINEDFLEEMVEMKELVMPVHGGGTKTIEVDYAFVKLEEKVDTITRREFIERQMSPINRTFKKAVEKYGMENSAVYEMVYPAMDKPINSRNFPYLISYLSLNEGVLGFRTLLNADEQYAIQITYDKNTLNDEKIWEILTAPKWNVLMKDGTIQEQDAKLEFKNPGKTL
jgi:NAD-dependent dihydropyrimidine dehydrogenase PreA subunit